ncbi:Gp37-like protein [Gordonia sp. NPDC003376]
MTAPGYARPNTVDNAFDYFDVGLRVGSGPGSKIAWRPVGRYLQATVRPSWGIEPGVFSFSLHPDHPLVSKILASNVNTTCWHFRCGYNGMQVMTGRIMDVDYEGAPGQAPYVFSGLCNKLWFRSMNAWVNNLLFPEVQVNLTGKQDIRLGKPDPVMKSYLASVATRLNVPVYPALPLRWDWDWPNLADIDSLDDLLDLILDLPEGLVAMSARFPSLADLFAPTTERLEMGVSVDLWDGHGTSPQVFNTSSLANLQSIIDRTSDGFLDLSRLLDPLNDGLYSLSMNRAGYVFDTAETRDRKHVQFRTDSGQITSIKYNAHHPEMYMAIVGGKSPAILNDIIEIGANLAIAGIIAGLATIPGLTGIGGLSVVVGDLFDDIFFAYEVFWDSDIRDAVGADDALPEQFTDNSASHSIEGYSVAHKALHEKGGSETLTLTVQGGAADGRGISFGADNGTARRYQLGDVVSVYDRGLVLERYVSEVALTHEPGKGLIEEPTIGKSQRAKGPWDRIFGTFGQAQSLADAVANAV